MTGSVTATRLGNYRSKLPLHSKGRPLMIKRGSVYEQPHRKSRKMDMVYVVLMDSRTLQQVPTNDMLSHIKWNKNIFFLYIYDNTFTCDRFIVQWASYQIRKIAGCACAGNAGNVFSRRRLQRKPLVSDPGMRHARSVMHVGIAYPRWRGKRSRHSRRRRTRNFTYLVRGPWSSRNICASSYPIIAVTSNVWTHNQCYEGLQW